MNVRKKLFVGDEVMGNRKFDNFDGFASKYRETHTNNIEHLSGADSNYFSEHKVIEVGKCEKNYRNKVILDLGCGDGNSAPYFIKHILPNKYYGIDISHDCIEVAKKNKLKRCHFQTYDGERIPFDADTFDIVFIANVLHHVDSSCHKQIISECYRVLKKSGRLYIFEHNPLNPLTRKIVKDCIFDVDAVLVPVNNIKRIVKEVGFQIHKRKYIIFFPRRFLFKFLIPLERYLQWCPLGGQYYVICYK